MAFSSILLYALLTQAPRHDMLGGYVPASRPPVAARSVDTAALQLRAEVTRLQTELAAAQQHNVQLTDDLTTLRQQLSTLQATVQELTTRLDVSTREPAAPPVTRTFLVNGTVVTATYDTAGFWTLTHHGVRYQGRLLGDGSLNYWPVME